MYNILPLLITPLRHKYDVRRAVCVHPNEYYSNTLQQLGLVFCVAF
jgi:hypothetical protein